MDKTTFMIRSVDTDTRTIEGIAAPYDETIDTGDYKERFAAGAFGEPQNVRLYSEHDHLDKRAPIGMVTKGEDTDAGYQITARISDTAKGNEIYQLVKDGVLDKFSVGFQPVEDTYDADTNTVTRTKVDLKEVSVVAFPAYKSAQILAVRTADKYVTVREDSTNTKERGLYEMTDENIEFATVADLADVRDAVDGLNRSIAILGDKDKEDVAPKFRSAGAFLKGVVGNDADALNEYRAYTGATTADSHQSNGWLDVPLKVVDRGRPLLNLFTRGSLPASGNVVTYPYISSITGDVASQANEGDDLGYMEVAVDTATAAVKTYGAYSELTRQVVERSDVAYLDAVLRAQAASYAKQTNAQVRSTLSGASAQAGTSFTLSSATAADVLGAVVDGVAKIDANGEGAQAEFVVVSADVWAKAVTLSSNGFAFDLRGDAGRTVGSANVPAIAGSLVGLPVVVDGNLAAKTFYVASADAITTWENASPIRLDDSNIINLSQVFSIYGYMAVGVTNANALVKAAVA